MLLPQSKFGLNIILPSTKFIQCQTVFRVALKSSPNVDINNLWVVTSTNKNIQYEIYKGTKDVLKAVRKENEERLQNQLILQGSFFSTILIVPLLHSTPYGHLFKANFRKTSLTSLSGISITHFRQEKTNQNGNYHRHLIALFAPHSKRCFISLRDVTYLNEGWFTWRHDSVLNFCASTLTAVQNSRLYADIPGFVNLSVLTSDNLRLDLLLAIENKCLYILELTVGFENKL